MQNYSADRNTVMVSPLEYKYFLQANILSGNLVPQFHHFLHLCPPRSKPVEGDGGGVVLLDPSRRRSCPPWQSPSSLPLWITRRCLQAIVICLCWVSAGLSPSSPHLAHQLLNSTQCSMHHSFSLAYISRSVLDIAKSFSISPLPCAWHVPWHLFLERGCSQANFLCRWWWNPASPSSSCCSPSTELNSKLESWICLYPHRSAHEREKMFKDRGKNSLNCAVMNLILTYYEETFRPPPCPTLASTQTWRWCLLPSFHRWSRSSSSISSPFNSFCKGRRWLK